MTDKEKQIREGWAKTRSAATLSRIDAFEAIPFLLNELDAIDQLLARREAIDDLPDRLSKVGFMVNLCSRTHDFLLREGHRFCDIPDCNCNSWHKVEKTRPHTCTFYVGAERCSSCGVLREGVA